VKSRTTLTAGVAAFVFLLAACGSGDDSASTDSADNSGAAGSSAEVEAFVEKAESIVEAASGEIPPTAPSDSPPIEPNKTIFTIPCAAAAQGCKIAVDEFARAAEAVGWKTTMIDPAGDPAKMADAVNQAVSQGADGIYTVAIDSATVKAPLEDAKAAGVQTVCFSCVDEPNLLLDTLPAEEQHREDGYALAAQAFLDSGEDLKAIVLRDNEFGNTRGREQGILDFVEDCQDVGASCEVLAEHNFLIRDIATTLPQQVAALVRSNPDWNALFGPYDAALLGVVPELRNNDLVGDDQRIYGFDPLDQNISWIRDGEGQVATVASPYRWLAYAAIDQMNRVFAGGTAADQGLRDKLITQSNAPAEGETYLGDGDPAATYMEQWGLE
jgi:ribose transport system substrate-binding protein